MHTVGLGLAAPVGPSAWLGEVSTHCAGPPQLMMSYTADGQMDERQLAERDARYGVSSKDKRREREVLNYPEVLVRDYHIRRPVLAA